MYLFRIKFQKHACSRLKIKLHKNARTSLHSSPSGYCRLLLFGPERSRSTKPPTNQKIVLSRKRRIPKALAFSPTFRGEFGSSTRFFFRDASPTVRASENQKGTSDESG